jgi:class 3 adenylate cyclase
VSGEGTAAGGLQGAGGAASSLRTFLIADVRGYTRYTQEHGDEEAARLAARFAELARQGIESHGGELLELRGDEALGVFASAREAIRAAVAL